MLNYSEHVFHKTLNDKFLHLGVFWYLKDRPSDLSGISINQVDCTQYGNKIKISDECAEDIYKRLVAQVYNEELTSDMSKHIDDSIKCLEFGEVEYNIESDCYIVHLPQCRIKDGAFKSFVKHTFELDNCVVDYSVYCGR